MKDYCTITIGEKTIGIRFQWLAQKWFIEASIGKDEIYYTADEEDKSFYTDFGLAKLIQCGYRNDNQVKETEDEFTFEDFHNWVMEKAETDEGKEELAKVVKIHGESTFSKKLIAEAEKKSNQNHKPEMITSQ